MAEDKNKLVKAESGDKTLPVPDVYQKPEKSDYDEEEDEINRRSEMPFLDHLEEFRVRILWCLGYLFVGILLGFYLNSKYDLLNVLVKPVKPYLANGKLMIIRPAEGFMIALKLSFAFGLVFASPAIIYHFWAFVAPALLKKERRMIFPLLFLSIFMFVLGAVMAYFVTLPLGMLFFSQFQFASTEFMLTAGSYLDIAMQMMFFTGLVFELPIVILILARFGIISPEIMRKYRRHAILAIFIIAMIVTPPDPGSMMLVGIPMVFLYELSVWISYTVARKKKKA
jgi:sec-independent protein translocase protein TatC